VDPLNKKVEGLAKMLSDIIRAFRERAASRRPGLSIPRVFSHVNDDTDFDDAPDSFVAARLRPRRPLGGSAIELPEPDEDLFVESVGASRDRH
jgi:hypothetical protein